MISSALKLVKSMVLKHTVTGSHLLAVAMLKGSKVANPIRRATSTMTVATKHCITTRRKVIFTWKLKANAWTTVYSQYTAYSILQKRQRKIQRFESLHGMVWQGSAYGKDLKVSM